MRTLSVVNVVSNAAIVGPWVPACAAKHLMMQLQHLNLGRNQLVGSLPETWSRLTSVSPVGLTWLLHASAAAAAGLQNMLREIDQSLTLRRTSARSHHYGAWWSYTQLTLKCTMLRSNVLGPEWSLIEWVECQKLHFVCAKVRLLLQLIYLSLSQNQFSGTLPSSWSKCKVSHAARLVL